MKPTLIAKHHQSVITKNYLSRSLDREWTQFPETEALERKLSAERIRITSVFVQNNKDISYGNI